MKYLKPRSLTWWTAMVPLIAGLVVALGAAIPDLAPVVAVINAASDGMPAAAMINMGLIGIGLRGAIGR